MIRELLAHVLAVALGVCIVLVVVAPAYLFVTPALAMTLAILLLMVPACALSSQAISYLEEQRIAKDEAGRALLDAAMFEKMDRERDELEAVIKAERERLRYARFEPRYGGQVVGVTHKEELARIERRLEWAL